MRQQLLERRGIATDAVGSRDVNLPSLIEERAPLRDGCGDAQANGDLDVLTFGCMYNEGHGNTLARRPMRPWSKFHSIGIAETRHAREREPTSMESPFRKSSSAIFPANKAAR